MPKPSLNPVELPCLGAVAGVLFLRLGSQGAALGQALLQRVGDLCAGAADEAQGDEAAILEDLDQDQRDRRAKQGVAGQARAAMAAALAALGPEAVLAVLPLDLDNVRAFRALRALRVSGAEAARAWTDGLELVCWAWPSWLLLLQVP